MSTTANRLGTYACLLLLPLVLSGVSACDEGQDLKNWIEHVNGLRTAALKQTKVRPFRQEQYQSLKAYFSEVSQMSRALQNDAKLRERFNALVLAVDLKEACKKVFITDEEWQPMLRGCQKNRFFLCADEVRDYPKLTADIRASLTNDNQKKWDKAESCPR